MALKWYVWVSNWQGEDVLVLTDEIYNHLIDKPLGKCVMEFLDCFEFRRPTLNVGDTVLWAGIPN